MSLMNKLKKITLRAIKLWYNFYYKNEVQVLYFAHAPVTEKFQPCKLRRARLHIQVYLCLHSVYSSSTEFT